MADDLLAGLRTLYRRPHVSSAKPLSMAAPVAQTYHGARPLRVPSKRVDSAILAALTNVYPEGLTRTEIRDLFSRNATAGAVTAALWRLQSLDRATMNRRATKGRGRPTEIWTYQRGAL